MSDAFALTYDELPEELPIFPLPRVILLPRVNLPLNIFEPRYLAMTTHAMKTGRLIGMVQPNNGSDSVYKTGCAGRIASYAETDDGRFLITLKGVCRFNIKQEHALDKGGFRKVTPDWAPYKADLLPEEPADICREAIMKVLEGYLSKMNMLCDQWDAMRTISCERLISTLSVICPFSVSEKQALLEAHDLEDRMKVLRTLLEMALKEDAKDLKDEVCGTCH